MRCSVQTRLFSAVLAGFCAVSFAACGSNEADVSLESIAADADESIGQLISSIENASASDKESLVQLRAAAATSVDTLSDSIEDVDAILMEEPSSAAESFRKALVSEREVAQSLAAAKLVANRIELATAKSELILQSAAGPQMRVVDTSALVESLNAASRKRRKPAASTPNAVAEPSTPATKSKQFYVGTGNISCWLTSESAACSVASNQLTFQVLGNADGETEDGAKFGRASGSRVDYGTTVAVGDFSCEIPPESASRGVVCLNNATGHGFEASKVPARQRTF